MSLKASGSYRVAESEQLSREITGPSIFCVVWFLDDTKENFTVDRKAKGQALLDIVHDCLELLERDYFGLQFLDIESNSDSVNNRKWLDPTKAVRKQIKTNPPYTFYFRVKFYVQDPTHLQEEYTRYHFFLQLKKDILEGRLILPMETAAVLASFAIQSELGDYSPEDHKTGYVSEFRFIPNQTANFEAEVVDLHPKRRGLSPAASELEFLFTARMLDHYGMEMFNVLDYNGVSIQLGVSCVGLAVFHEMRRTQTYVWNNIIKLSFKKKQFFIQLKKSSLGGGLYSPENTAGPACIGSDSFLGFTLLSATLAKSMWRTCIDYHTFFRMRSAAYTPPTVPRLLGVNRTPTFTGRTLHQVLESKRRARMVDRGFLRTPTRRFARRTVAGYSSAMVQRSSAVPGSIGRRGSAGDTGNTTTAQPNTGWESTGTTRSSRVSAALLEDRVLECDGGGGAPAASSEEDTSDDDDDEGGFKCRRPGTFNSSGPISSTSLRNSSMNSSGGNKHQLISAERRQPLPHSTTRLASSASTSQVHPTSTSCTTSASSLYCTVPRRASAAATGGISSYGGTVGRRISAETGSGAMTRTTSAFSRSAQPSPIPTTRASGSGSGGDAPRFSSSTSTPVRAAPLSRGSAPLLPTTSPGAPPRPPTIKTSYSASFRTVPAASSPVSQMKQSASTSFRNASLSSAMPSPPHLNGTIHGPERTSPPVSSSSNTAGEGLVTIRIRPDQRGRFGFNVKGGFDQSLPIIVSRVGVNMPADLSIPRLHEGDQVLYINGRDISNHTHEQVVQFIRSAAEKHSGELLLVVRPSMYISDDINMDQPEVNAGSTGAEILTGCPSNGSGNDSNSTTPLATAVVSPSVPVYPMTPTKGETGDPVKDSILVLEETLKTGLCMTQFEQIYRRKPGLTMGVAREVQNAGKNRYRDISPYDSTRVVLQEGDDGDYINASFVNMEIPKSGIVNRYIASQGPLPHTCSDFWQMCWEQKTALVVMLTASSERGRAKCHQYWPNLYETAEYGGVQLTCLREQLTSSVAYRELMLYRVGSREERRISHMQYISWPDHGLPTDVTEFIQFVQTVRQTRAGHVDPTVVHCSAGIGRTGVLITMETAMCLIEANQPVYPLELVRQMRDQRAMLIQTPGQYQFVCESILKVYNDGIVKPQDEFTS